MTTPERIAIVKLSALGDVVHALPVACALRMHWPAVRLTWVVEHRYREILRRHHAIDEVVTVDTRRWRRARRPAAIRAALHDVAAVHRRLRAARFDVALDLQGLLKSATVASATRAPLRIGFPARRCREPLAALLTNRHVTPPASARHVVDQYLALLGPLGIAAPSRVEFGLSTEPSADAAVAAFFRDAAIGGETRLVVLNPGAARRAKRWPAARFAALARLLVHDARARVVVLWGPGEDSTARAIAGAARDVTVAPPTDLFAMLAVLRCARVVVAADTGPLHLAAGVGVPCVGLFGPTSAERNGPYGPGHRTLASPDGAMDSITVDAVFEAVAVLLDERDGRAPGASADADAERPSLR